MKPVNPNRLDELYRDAYLLATIAADQNRLELDQVCRKFHISIAQYPVLWVLCLSDANDGVPMSEIADGLVTRAADSTRLVDRLVESGFVTRRQSAEDRRKVLVQITAKGRKVFGGGDVRDQGCPSRTVLAAFVRRGQDTDQSAQQDGVAPRRSAVTERYVDVHSPIASQFYVDVIKSHGYTEVGGRDTPEWSPEISLGLMDRNHIEMAVTSLSAPATHFGDDRAAQELARRCNEFIGRPGPHPSVAFRDLRDPPDAVRRGNRGRGRLRARYVECGRPCLVEFEQRRFVPRRCSL